MADDSGEALVRRYYEEALNPGSFDRLDDLLTDDFVDHEELRGIPPTRDGLKQKYTMLRAGFTDFGFTVEDLFSAGVFRIANGRIAEHWGVFDQLAMLGQLGAFGG